jgi:crossover junction endodeoxyribonuclease RuvC|tara:strand:- start:175 stop:660 length:486 start_codon:yes stop_codon:yes gene_type:complete
MKKPVFLGIDPGKKGALALFDPSDNSMNIMDMPTQPKLTKKGEDTNYAMLGQLMEPPAGVLVHCMLENVWSMPREGVSSAFAFGLNNGALLMGLSVHKIPFQLVTAAKWKKYYGLSSDKGASRAMATQRFPENAKEFSRVKDDGRAEAAMLALYASEQYQH